MPLFVETMVSPRSQDQLSLLPLVVTNSSQLCTFPQTHESAF